MIPGAMNGFTNRRHLLQAGAAAGALGFLSKVPLVGAEEAKLDPEFVQFRPEIEPLVRLLEETSRDKVLEEVAARIESGTTYREVLAALLLAGVRNIQPRPVGFKFHAVLVVNSAHLAAQNSPDSDRWLPIFWALDQFKSSQARDVKEGNWTMASVDEKAVPAADKARATFEAAMDRWDVDKADAAVAGLARTGGAQQLFDVFARYGARDFRDIGHKAIYVSNSWRTLQNIGQVMRFAVATGRAESDPTVALRKTIAFPIGPWFQLGDPRLVLALFLGLIEFALSWREAARRPRAS